MYWVVDGIDLEHLLRLLQQTPPPSYCAKLHLQCPPLCYKTTAHRRVETERFKPRLFGILTKTPPRPVQYIEVEWLLETSTNERPWRMTPDASAFWKIITILRTLLQVGRSPATGSGWVVYVCTIA
jgi:hypothetical protein